MCRAGRGGPLLRRVRAGRRAAGLWVPRSPAEAAQCAGRGWHRRVSIPYPLVKRGELWRLETPISAANRVVLIISDTDFDRYRNQVLTCDVVSTDPGGPPLTVRLEDSAP